MIRLLPVALDGIFLRDFSYWLSKDEPNLLIYPYNEFLFFLNNVKDIEYKDMYKFSSLIDSEDGYEKQYVIVMWNKLIGQDLAVYLSGLIKAYRKHEQEITDIRKKPIRFLMVDITEERPKEIVKIVKKALEKDHIMKFDLEFNIEFPDGVKIWEIA